MLVIIISIITNFKLLLKTFGPLDKYNAIRATSTARLYLWNQEIKAYFSLKNYAIRVQFYWWESQNLKLGKNSIYSYSSKAGIPFKISLINPREG